MQNNNDDFDDVPMGQKIKTGFKSIIPEQLPSSLQHHSQNQAFQNGAYNAGQNMQEGDFVPVPPMTSQMSRPIRIALGAVGALFVVAMIWSFTSGNGNKNGAEFANLPVLQASDEPFRIRPENPGGMEIPNADSTLYGALDGNADANANSANTGAQADSGVAADAKKSSISGFAGLSDQPAFLSLEDDLNNEAETAAADQADTAEQAAQIAAEPVNELGQAKIENLTAVITPKQPKVDENLVESVVEPTQDQSEPSAVDAPEAPIIAEEKTPEIKDVAETKDVAVEAPKPSAKPAAPVKAASSSSTTQKPVSDVVASVLNEAPKAAQPTATASGTHYVQLGSVKSTADASVEWGRMLRDFPQVLTGQSYRTQQADLGARGIYHRIQMGPYTKDKAQDLCTQLKNAGKKGGCLVVAR